ncbi:MAG: hypothetical protein OXH47_10160 [Paracoccaceae bacterium]|nr:hypothetical protein [Paracoccaceae bacterium]
MSGERVPELPTGFTRLSWNNKNCLGGATGQKGEEAKETANGEGVWVSLRARYSKEWNEREKTGKMEGI